MKQENLDELKNIYLGLVTGEEQLLNEGPYSVTSVQKAQQAQQGRDTFAGIGGYAGLSKAASAAGDNTGAQKYMKKSQQIGDKIKADNAATSAKQQSQRAQNRADDVSAYRKAFNIQPPKPPTDVSGLSAGAALKAKAEAAEKAKPELKPPTGAPLNPTATPTAPVKPAASAAQKPTAAPAKPMGGAPMDQWARANPTLAAKVKPGQSGYDTIKTRLSADNDRGPSTPTPSSSSSSTTSGSSSSSGETDRLKKALDIKKSDVTSSYQWPSVKTLKNIADAYSSVYEKKEYEPSRDQDKDGDNDFADNMIARMVASGMSREEAIKKVKNKDYNKKNGLDEATAMAKRGLNEPAIRQKIAKSTGGGKAADRATALEKQPTYGDANKATQRQKYARAQRGDFRDTTSSDPGLRGYAYQSDDPEVKAKQAARGAQRSALTPREKKQLNREAYEIYELVASYLLENNFVSTIKDANIVIENMSENWFNQIIKEEIN